MPPEFNKPHYLAGRSAAASAIAENITGADTPLPLRPRAKADAAILSNWWDAPQPLQPPQRSAFFNNEPPAEPPFLSPRPARSQATGLGIAAGVGTFILNGEPADLEVKQSRFETLEARVAVLEAALAARPDRAALVSRPAGIGHNHGPYLDENLNVDEASIQNLIALLKVERATAPVDLAKLVEAAKVADPTINKWQERVDIFVKGVLFGAGKMTGEEITKQLEHASWVQSVFSALQAVFEAIKGLFF